jgi:capsule biosynthesis phosphatase
MKIVIDIDGTICPIKNTDEDYADLQPLPNAVEKIQSLKDAGHYIILNTARNMATQGGNLGKIMKNVGKTTLDWLEKHKIPYDEIYFGKPNAHVYIDDRAYRFTGWENVTEEILLTLPKEK